MKSGKKLVLATFALLAILLGPGIAAERCRDCIGDTCAMVGGQGFRSCWEIPIYQKRCIRWYHLEPYYCVEYEDVPIGAICRTSLGGCIGAY
jgi:hypothetical protein